MYFKQIHSYSIILSFNYPITPLVELFPLVYLLTSVLDPRPKIRDLHRVQNVKLCYATEFGRDSSTTEYFLHCEPIINLHRAWLGIH